MSNAIGSPACVSTAVNLCRRATLLNLGAATQAWAQASRSSQQGLKRVSVVTGEWAPFTGAHLHDGGFFTAYTRALFEEATWEADVSFVPWRRAEMQLSAGESFAAFPYAITAERRSKYEFSAPVTKTRSKVFFLKDHWRKEVDLARLNAMGALIGVPAGSAAEEELRSDGFRVSAVHSDASLFRMLLSGRVDAIVANEFHLVHHLRQLAPETLANVASVDLPRSDAQMDTMFMVSRTYPGARELLAALNVAINSPKMRALYQQLANPYLLMPQAESRGS